MSRVSPRLTLFLAVLAGILAVQGLARPALARDIFTVRDVAVDVTAASAAAAREAALLDGQRKAFGLLMHRLVLRDDYGKIPVLADPQLLDLVQGIEVEQEKTSQVRYLGKLLVTFWPDKVRDFLRGNGVRYAETVSKPVVVIPVGRTASGLVLWDDSNPWFVAWAKHAPPNGLVPLIVPLGDLSDIAGITADEAVQGNTEKLLATARRYGAAEALVAVASASPEPQGIVDLDIAINRFGAPQDEQTQILRVAGQAGEPADALYSRAVDEATAQIEDQWKRENLLRFGEEETLTATVPIGGLKDWIEMRRRLNDVVVVRQAELVSLSHDQAVVRLHFIGGPGQLTTALAQKDVELTQGEGGAQGATDGVAAAPAPASSNAAPAGGSGGATLGATLAQAAPSAGWVLRFANASQPSPSPQAAPSSQPAPAAVSNPNPSPGSGAANPGAAATPPAPPSTGAAESPSEAGGEPAGANQGAAPSPTQPDQAKPGGMPGQ